VIFHGTVRRNCLKFLVGLHQHGDLPATVLKTKKG
jgi:hypothetical protein